MEEQGRKVNEEERKIGQHYHLNYDREHNSWQ